MCFLSAGKPAQNHPTLTPQNKALVLYHGNRSEKAVALTFDACPAYGPHSFDRKVFQTLVDSQVPATLFLSGKWIKTHKNEMRELTAVPFLELGNHSYSHPHMANMPPDSIIPELQEVQQMLSKLYQRDAKVFRSPFAELSDGLVQSARSLGLTTVQFDLASGDPDTSITREQLTQYVIHSVRNGSVVVMHINGRGRHTAEALPEIIGALRKKGFYFVTVSEFLFRSPASKHLPARRGK
jgi:peptidoglycan/xylan/chitin deacetylase (PgdA/CDA1 family)